jgi:S1-C subfamily serine protease
MKVSIVTIGLCVVFYGHGLSQAKLPSFPNGIVTLSGQSYEDVKVDDVFTNDSTLELRIVYDKPSGVEAVTTVDVDDLPPEWQNYCKSYKAPPFVGVPPPVEQPHNNYFDKFDPPKASDIITLPDSPTASGTGFFITDDGYLITNYHVVKDATKVRLVTSAGTIASKVVQVDQANDIALLKADGQFEPLPIVSSRTAQLGSTVATIGFPDPSLQGYSPKLAKGEIASLAGIQDDSRYFQISVPVQPGNSGGALVDDLGNVIGIVSAKLDESVALAASGALPENVNYAVKSSLILSFLESAPAVSAKLKTPNTAVEPFSDVVKSAQGAAVLVLVY